MRVLIQRRDFKLLVALLVVLSAILAFAGVAELVEDGTVRHFDEAVLLALRSPTDPSQPLGGPVVETVMRDLTALGGWAVLTLVTILVAGFLALMRRYRQMTFLLVAVIGGQLLSATMKGFYKRPRPDLVPHLTTVTDASFPSGHSMMSAVVYLTLGALLARFLRESRLRLYVIGCAMLLSFLVGVSRLYLGVHYPTDVVAGWTAGTAWATLCWLTARQLQRRGQVESSSVG